MPANKTLDAKGFVKNLAGFSMGTWIGAVINFAVVPLATRLYAPEQLGSIELFITTLNLIAMFITLGLDQAYVRYYNEPPGGYTHRQLLTRCVTGTVCVWAAVSAGIFLLRDYISVYIANVSGSFIAVMLIGNLLATAVIRYLNLTFRMQNNIRGYTLQAVMMVFFGKVFYVAAAVFDSTYRGAILVNTLTMLPLMLIYAFLQRDNFDRSGIRPKKEVDLPLLGYALPLMPVAVFTWLNDSAAKYFIKLFSKTGLSNVAIFSSAARLTAILALIQTGFNTYWVSFVYQNYKSEQNKIKSIHDYISALMFIMAVAIIAAEDIVFLFLGEGVRGGMAYFPFLMITPVLYTISETTCIGINLSKKTHLHIITSGLAMAANLGVCLLLIPRFGDLGGAVAVGCSGLVMFITRTLFGQREYKSVASPAKTGLSTAVFIVFCFFS
ncbi:MAG TPA: hypothetical protein DEQ02_00680, partial [Ruminococcaceae bacterium]|nr:hypothetical protein [Oscillospiraceae bacterium]